ncbi:YdcF family protein [Rhodanobacter sp. 7MK24]|uniref:YdcF family protein n=1 Tax=Rhodanobacter sp. 7MK24 TaxID=2775922 RepID=UPI00177C2F39|nr:YdcF family protein [Rhodanobacter sp. 7MK24]MBD8879747.1 YdcF family protein [Rhodanobacter sp. 7MK24]
MTMDVLIVLVLLGLALRVLKRRRTAAVALWLAVLLFLATGCGLLPAWLLGSLQGPYARRPTIAWAPRNAIVLLGAGAQRAADGTAEPGEPAHSRINEALALYRECKASGMDCRLEVSGGDARHIGESEAAVYAAALERMGVSAADLLLEPRSMNTWQNAQFSAPLLHAYGAQRVLLVSSATHLRRASLYFAHFGVAITPVRSDWLKERMDWWPQSWNFAVADVALHEYVGVWRYKLYEAMGWNVRATSPGDA